MIRHDDNNGFKTSQVLTTQQLSIGIIDADLLDNGSRFPNLALLKISAYCKTQNHNVRLICSYDEVTDLFDIIILSKVFKFTTLPKQIEDLIDQHKIIFGGTGFYEINAPKLEYEVEHIMPDYNLYLEFIDKNSSSEKDKIKKFKSYLDFSIGFTTRGCFRHCPFCVNRTYNKSVKHSDLSEFYDSNKKGIILYDDNVLASSDFENIIEQLKATNKPFQFKQGLDIRLLTEKKAQLLSDCKYYGDFIFAFDHIKDAPLIEQKLTMWKRYTDKSTKLYVLTAYEAQDETDIANTFERIKILMEHNCKPFVMCYEAFKQSRFKTLYNSIARWCNQPSMFRHKSFREWCICDDTCFQKQSNNHKVEHIASYRAMTAFENEFPDIAKKYFDLKYDDYLIDKNTQNTTI